MRAAATILAALIVLAPAVSARGVTRPSTRPVIVLGELPLLFADDAGVADRAGVVRTVHPARTRDAPVLQADQPWETKRVYLYGSVIADPAGGGLRMWYGARQPETKGPRRGSSPSLRGDGFDLVLYAASSDGLAWTKPPLRMHAFAGSLDNNIVFDLHSPSVLLDRFEVDPARRYKMLGALRSGYYAATSPDGLGWTAVSDEPVLKQFDTITLTQDPSSGEYLAFHKRMAAVRGVRRRVVWLSRSSDFRTWSEPELVFKPDEEDDAWVTRPQERTEVYNMSVYPHAAGFIGLPTIFRVTREFDRAKILPAQSPVDGPIDVQLVTSPDGRNWSRSWPRLNIIPRGAPGAFDAGAILGVSSTPVHVGDETWVYYTALTTGHGAPVPPKRITIGRAQWRRHGFVSLDADRAGGRVETTAVRFATPSLVVNADAARGELRVALLEADGRPIDGYALDDCEPLKADATRWSVRWKNRTAPPVDRPVKVVIEMKCCRLFSLACDDRRPE